VLMWSVTDLQRVRMRLDRGANMNARSKRGRTPVMIAVMSNRSAEIVRFLISKGVDLNGVGWGEDDGANGRAPGNDTETIRIMVEAGLVNALKESVWLASLDTFRALVA